MDTHILRKELWIQMLTEAKSAASPSRRNLCLCQWLAILVPLSCKEQMLSDQWDKQHEFQIH